jgi:hypothetical protein
MEDAEWLGCDSFRGDPAHESTCMRGSLGIARMKCVFMALGGITVTAGEVLRTWRWMHRHKRALFGIHLV